MSDQVLPQPPALGGPAASHSVQPTQMHVRGVELHYIEAGRGEPLILLSPIGRGKTPAFTERPVLGCFLFSQSLDLPCVVLLT